MVWGFLLGEEMENIRIPYKGGKQAIALKLIKEMQKYKPNAKYFIDLFGGGGSMSFTALQMGYKVLYNENDTNLFNFVDYCLNKTTKGKYGIFPDEWYKFVSREEFFRQKELNTPFSEFCRIVYSFGNNRKAYLFNPELEKNKHLLHNAVVFNCQKSLDVINKIFDTKVKLSSADNYNNRRLEIMRQVKIYGKRIELQQLQQLQQLEQLQQLQQLEQLEQLQQLQLSNKSYNDVELSKYNDDEVIIYCDPPYRGTDSYLMDFDCIKFDEWFTSQKYLIFLSEYNVPLNKIYSINKRVTLSRSSNALKKQENLYTNKGISIKGLQLNLFDYREKRINEHITNNCLLD
jgi:site-specific DNA-adenine methylase